jgi:hypothetical protein
MHRLIAHFQCIAPTWLLLEWIGHRPPAGRAPPAFVFGIVAVGLLKWIEGSQHTVVARVKTGAAHMPRV